MLDYENDPEVREVLTSKLLTDFGFFARYYFMKVYRKKMSFADHHKKIARTMEAVARGDIRRLIINIPPRYSKTEMAVKLFVPWCLANNPRGKFMHLSYADSLVKDNSDAIRDIVKHEAFTSLFPDTIVSRKTDSKEKWYTTRGGGIYAVSTGSPITGFGAGLFGERQYEGTGSPADGFGGAIIIDDPLKPADAESDVKRERINARFNNTISSRVNSEETPIIVIMQRIHDHDMAGFLMDGGSGEKWDVLSMPAIKEDGTPLWPEKHSLETLKAMEKADPPAFAAQYMQSPMVASGNIFKREWFRYYTDKDLPLYFDKVFQSWDLTFKKSKGSDFVSGQVWGKKGANFYLLHQVHERMSFTDTIANLLQVTRAFPQALAKYVEEKANGDAVMDTLQNTVEGIIPVTPRESKVARAHAVTPLFQAGNVYFPKDAPWLAKYEDELTKFPNVEHDDQVDATSQGLSQESGTWSVWDNL